MQTTIVMYEFYVVQSYLITCKCHLESIKYIHEYSTDAPYQYMLTD